MATNFQDLVAKVKNLVALVPVLGAILCPAMRCQVLEHETPKVMSLILSAA